MTQPRVLVVDDSAFARTVISRLLRDSGKVDVIGTARDGADALEKITALQPDVVTLDLTMPVVDGLAVLRALDARPHPRVIVVSISAVDSDLGAEALALGAVDLVAKPTALASERLNEIGQELVAKVLGLTAPRPALGPAPPASTRRGSTDLVVIGTSTGGPQALTRIVSALKADLAAPVAIALHIPAGYTESLAQRLDRLTPLRVVEATEGLQLARGLVVLARGGTHLRVERRGAELYAIVSPLPIAPFTPSVDELFVSAAAAAGARTLGVVLTGMGDDGTVGARAIASAGGMLLTESPASCVVYGMPRSVHDAGLGSIPVHLDRMAMEIAARA